MRYAQIRKMDISNGNEIGVSLFVQGCRFHCYNCFNQDTWDFDKGNEWNDNIEQTFINLIDRPFIKRVSILGGEPLVLDNLQTVHDLVVKIKNKYPNIKIWLYTGYTYEYIINNRAKNPIRYDTIKLCDYIVDGQFIDDLKDFKLLYRGSSNQRIIDINKSNDTNIVLYKA